MPAVGETPAECLTFVIWVNDVDRTLVLEFFIELLNVEVDVIGELIEWDDSDFILV